MPSSLWTLRSLVVFLNSAKRKKKERNLNSSLKGGKALLCRNRKPNESSCEEILLTDEIWSIICNKLSPLDVLHMRSVNRQLNRVVLSRLNSLIYFDVLKCDAASELVTNGNSKNDFYRAGKKNLYLHMQDRSVIVVVDQRWTIRDIQAVWGAIQFFAPYARSVTIDSALLELTTAALSSTKLTRFYAFICYVNAIGAAIQDELHLACTQKTVHKKTLFPKLTELTIRATPSDICCLSRLADYGVDFSALCSSDGIELVRCALLDLMSRYKLEQQMNVRLGAKRLNHHVRAFKEWIRSNELKEKYVQYYSF